MNGADVLRVVDAIHRDKNIDKEIVFEGIEQAILSAARKHFGEENEIVVDVDRDTGRPAVTCDGQDLDPDEIGDLLGRIPAQAAKQVMIQKIREAERDALYEEFDTLRGQIVTGTVTRIDGGTVTVNLGKVEGILPRGEQIPGESHHVGERVRAIVLDVRKAGTRVKIILSRTHPELVRRLFELEIPEVGEHVIEVRSLAREAGYRSKVAVSCYDSKIDCVGACVGVRGSRIKSVVDELSGERIDIVRWNDSLQVLVPNALQPAEVEDVILCPMLGKVIVLVHDDQLSLAIGKKGQNVRLASKLVGWDIHVMTQEKLGDQLEQSMAAFAVVPGVSDELAEALVSQGFFTFDDLSVIEPDQLAELGGLTPEQCDEIVAYADAESARLEAEDRKAARAIPVRAPVAGEPDASAVESEEAAKEVAVEEVAVESDTEAGPAMGSDESLAVLVESSETTFVGQDELAQSDDGLTGPEVEETSEAAERDETTAPAEETPEADVSAEEIETAETETAEIDTAEIETPEEDAEQKQAGEPFESSRQQAE